MSMEDQMYQIERMRRHLSSRCKGLLEVPLLNPLGPEAYVQYLNRTVKDFLEEDRARILLTPAISAQQPNFDPHLTLCAAHLRRVQVLGLTPHEKEGRNECHKLVREFLHQCRWMERQGSGDYVPFLTEMDRTVALAMWNRPGEDLEETARFDKLHVNSTRVLDQPDSVSIKFTPYSLFGNAVARGLTVTSRTRWKAAFRSWCIGLRMCFEDLHGNRQILK